MFRCLTNPARLEDDEIIKPIKDHPITKQISLSAITRRCIRRTEHALLPIVFSPVLIKRL